MTDKEINELRQKRAKALADARAIHDRATKENRDLNADEQKSYDGFMNERSALDKQIQREENIRKLAADDATVETRDLPNNPEERGDDAGQDQHHTAIAFLA